MKNKLKSGVSILFMIGTINASHANNLGVFGEETSDVWDIDSSRHFSGDFNGDGLEDIGVQNGTWYIRYNNGDGTFGNETAYYWGNGANNQFVGDFNGDGYDDIGVQDGRWYIRYGNGDGTFGNETSYWWGNGANNQFAGDFNGDGFDDIGVQDGRWYIRYGNGDGTFGNETSYWWGNGATKQFAGDFNGDGYDDIGVQDGRWYIRYGNGDGTFGNETSYWWGNGATAQFAGDFNRDGLDDIGVQDGTWFIRYNLYDDSVTTRFELNNIGTWAAGLELEAGKVISHEGELYEVVQTHITQADWTPPNVAALFKKLTKEQDNDDLQECVNGQVFSEGECRTVRLFRAAYRVNKEPIELGLGNGLDILTGEPRRNCLNEEDYGLIKKEKTKFNYKTFYAEDFVSAADKLDIDLSANASISFKSLGVDTDFKVDFLHDIKWSKKSIHFITAMRFSDRVEYIDRHAPPLKPTMMDYLNTNQKQEVRFQCGDKYASSQSIGGEIFFHFRALNTTYNSEEKKSSSSKIKAKIDMLINLKSKLNTDIESELIRDLESEGVSIECTAVGGKESICTELSLNNIRAKIQEYRDSLQDPELKKPIDIKYKTYQQDVMGVTQNIKNLRKWIEVDEQANLRLSLSRDESFRSSCEQIKPIVVNFLQRCNDSSNHHSCYHPTDELKAYCDIDNFKTNLDDDVGVITDGDCPVHRRVWIHMDDDSKSFRTGWTGNIEGKTRLHFCRVDGEYFRAFHRQGSGSKADHYAVLKLDRFCPEGARTVVRYFDNDGGGNDSFGDIAPNVSSGNTELHFCFMDEASEDFLVMQQFPDLGFDYGVFGRYTHEHLVADRGMIHTDDENRGNKNKFYVHDDTKAELNDDAIEILEFNAKRIIEPVPKDTNLHVVKVKR